MLNRYIIEEIGKCVKLRFDQFSLKGKFVEILKLNYTSSDYFESFVGDWMIRQGR